MIFDRIFAGSILLVVALVFLYVIRQIWGDTNEETSANGEHVPNSTSGREMGRILLPIAIGLVVLALIVMSGAYVHFNKVGAGIAAGGALFSYIGIMFITKGNKKKKRCTASCMGRVVDHLEHEDNERHITYSPIINYIVKEKEYTLYVGYSGSENSIPQIGDVIEVFYDPMAPGVAQAAYERKEGSVFAIWFLAFGIPMFLIGLNICMPLRNFYWIIQTWLIKLKWWLF